MTSTSVNNQLPSGKNYLFTSESVSEGHPDKMADQISDAILDAFLTLDPDAKVACETVLANQFVLVAGEFKTSDPTVFETVRRNAESIVRQVIRDIGYTSIEDGIDPDQCEIKIAFNHQSAHINQGVDLANGEIGAGDQGLMFGYACDETPEFMPLAISLANKLVRKQAELRKSGALPWLRPDSKSQVSVRYVNGEPTTVEKVVLSTQHSPDISTEDLREIVRKEIVEAVIPVELRSDNFEVLINPTGRFEIGGPNGDTGLTGRKIIVDTYGGSCPHGGGAFSGKDPSKVDRSAAYMARYIAKNIVAAGLAKKCLVQLAYAIGVVKPVSLLIDTFGTAEQSAKYLNWHKFITRDVVPGTEKQSDEYLEILVQKTFGLSPQSIICELDLKRPIYRQTSSYGHFGRTDITLPWENVIPQLGNRFSRQEYLKVLAKVEVFRNNLNVPGYVNDKSLPRYNRSRTAIFGHDLSLAMEFLRKRGLIPICDKSVEQLSKSAFPCSDPEYLEVYDRVIFTDMRVLDKLTKDDPSIVWISWGSQMGLAADKYFDNFRRDGQVYGIVGASASNGGYAGLRLCEVVNCEGPGVLRRSKQIANFCAGVEPLADKADGLAKENN